MAVYDGKVWFGNQRYGTWIKAPLADMNASSVGFSTEQTFNNGGSFVKSSFGSAKSFDMSWNGDLDELQVIKNFKDGLYGGGLVYWEDPFAKNILPPHWAAPMLTVRDWPSLISSDNKPTPVIESSSGSDRNLPYQSAVYTVTNTTETSRSLTILIPEDHMLRLGFVYSRTGTASIKVVPVLQSTGQDGAPIEANRLSEGDSSLYDSSLTFTNVIPLGSASYERVKAVRVYISKSDATPSTVTMRGGIATLFLADGISGHGHDLWSSSVQNGTNWTAGQGFTGCVMSQVPTIEYKNIIGNKKLITMSTTLKEVEAWL
jgi:hypothetical protein